MDLTEFSLQVRDRSVLMRHKPCIPYQSWVGWNLEQLLRAALTHKCPRSNRVPQAESPQGNVVPVRTNGPTHEQFWDYYEEG